jgi:succinate dehydrogenase / fumarate reductase, cytochrome b subunit
MSKPRPIHLNLITIQLPLPGLVSILHRVSGAALFLFLPLLLWLWQESVESAETFEVIHAVVANPFMKLVLLGLLWGYLHHVCAGIRHLALDLHIGAELAAARASSMAVMVVSIGLTLIAAVALW